MQLSERIGRRIKLQDLHVLMAVVQAGSMRKAAAHLNTTQPSVSRSIAELEEAVGVPLLDRSPQGVEPTAYGRALIDGGAAMFDDLRQTVKNIELLADPEAGEIRVGATPPLTASFVSSVANRLARRLPRIVFHLVAMSTDKIYNELGERNLDLLIARRLGTIADERHSFEFLFDDPYRVVAGAQNPWARRRSIRLAELINESWTLPPPESPPGALARETFRVSGLEYPRTTVFTLNSEARMNLLATGNFLTILPASALRFPTRLPELKVLPVELPIPPVAIGVVTLKNRMLSPVAPLFTEHAREVAKELVKKK